MEDYGNYTVCESSKLTKQSNKDEIKINHQAKLQIGVTPELYEIENQKLFESYSENSES